MGTSFKGNLDNKNLDKIFIEGNDVNRVHRQNAVDYMSPLLFASFIFCTFNQFELIIKNGADINFKKDVNFKDFKYLENYETFSILGDLIYSLYFTIIRNYEENLAKKERIELYLKKINLLIDCGVIIDMTFYFVLSKFISEEMKILLLENTKLDPNIFLYKDLRNLYL
jgi:hypothetical protein